MSRGTGAGQDLGFPAEADDVAVLQRHGAVATHARVVDERAALGVHVAQNVAVLLHALDQRMPTVNRGALQP